MTCTKIDNMDDVQESRDVGMKHDRIPVKLHITKISKHQLPIQLDPIEENVYE